MPAQRCTGFDPEHGALVWPTSDFPRSGEMLHCVKTGETGIKQALGATDPFAYLSEHPEQAQVFHACMTEISRLNTPAIVEAYDFGHFRKIIDVG